MSIESVVFSVPLSTATVLAYSMLLVVAVFLVSGPALVYYYWRQSKKHKTANPTQAPQASH